MVPAGWTVSNEKGTPVASVAPGATLQATFDRLPGLNSAAGLQTIGAKASYKDSTGAPQETSGANQMHIAYGSLQGAFNNISVTTANGAFVNKLGNFDGGGDSFSAEQLATTTLPAGGVTRVSTVTVDAIPAALAAGAHELALQQNGTVLARTAIVVTAAAVDVPAPNPADPDNPAGSGNPADPGNPAGPGNTGDQGNPGRTGGGAGDLAHTGASVLVPAGLALLLLLGGAAALLTKRRRRA